MVDSWGLERTVLGRQTQVGGSPMMSCPDCGWLLLGLPRGPGHSVIQRSQQGWVS